MYISSGNKNDSKFKSSLQIGLWVYVSNSYNPNGITFACTKNDLTTNTMLLSIAKNYNAWKVFIKNYKLGNVYYETLKIKLAIQDILSHIIT